MMSDENIISRIKFNYNSDDIREYISGKNKTINIIFTVLLVFLLSLIFVLNYEIFYELELVRIAPFLMLIVFLVMINLYSYYLLPKRQFKNNKFFQEGHEIIFTNDFIKIIRHSGTQEIKWDYIYKIVEYKKVIGIHDSRFTAFVIPKRAFEAPDDIIKVRNLLKEKLPKNKIKLSS